MGRNSPVLIFFTHIPDNLDVANSLKRLASWSSWTIISAATMCEFSKQEFIGGLQALGIDSLEKFCDRMQFMRSELKDEQKFQVASELVKV
ncbi:unnamed protein product [Camellia sinensis]